MNRIRSDNRGLIVVCPSCAKANRMAFDRLGLAVRCGNCQATLAAPAEPVEVLTSADFDALVGQSRLPVLVDFWAAWCGPCRMVAPQIEQVAKTHSGAWLVVKIDTELVSDLATRLGIRSIPTLAVFSGGKEAGRTMGAMLADRIEAFVRQSITAH